MPASKPASPRSSADPRYGETDFAKVDAHEIMQQEYEELPELTDEWFAGADFYLGDRLIRHGAKSAPTPMAGLVQLHPRVLAHFQALGPDWEARVNAVLMEVVERERAEKVR